jgi:hypothetical protein
MPNFFMAQTDERRRDIFAVKRGGTAWRQPAGMLERSRSSILTMGIEGFSGSARDSRENFAFNLGGFAPKCPSSQIQLRPIEITMLSGHSKAQMLKSHHILMCSSDRCFNPHHNFAQRVSASNSPRASDTRSEASDGVDGSGGGGVWWQG